MPNPFDTIIPVFPNIIHKFDIENFKEIQESVIDYVYDEENNDPIGVFKSNQGGWQSKPCYTRHDNIIKSILDKEFDKHFSNPEFFKRNFKMSCDNAWININRNNDSNRLHHHPNCHLAGVFWIKVPNDCDSGDIQFPNPSDFVEANLLEIYSDKLRDKFKCWDVCCFKPKDGRIIIFPSHLMHEVRVNRSRQDRISVSFNIKIEV